LSMLGYLLLTIEIILYTIHHSLLDISYLWIFYVVGAPLSFLPVMMLAWRIKIIYTGMAKCRATEHFCLPVHARSALHFASALPSIRGSPTIQTLWDIIVELMDTCMACVQGTLTFTTGRACR
jgi:hypothetical protein